MDLRTHQLFRILIPFLNVSNDNELSRQYRQMLYRMSLYQTAKEQHYRWERFLLCSPVSSYREVSACFVKNTDFSCSYRGGRKRINGRHRKEAICHDSCQRIYDRYGTLSFFLLQPTGSVSCFRQIIHWQIRQSFLLQH